LRKQITEQRCTSFNVSSLPSWKHKAMAYAVCVTVNATVLDWEPATPEEQEWVNDFILWVRRQ